MNKQQMLKRIQELDELRAELVSQTQPADSIQALADAQPKIKPGSVEHEALLATGYKMNKAEAQTIIKEYKANPASWPYAVLKNAQAFMEALGAKPQVISTRQPWRSRHRSRVLNATG